MRRLDLDRQGQVEGQRLDRAGQTAVGEHRRVDAADDVAQVAQRCAAGLPGLGEHPARLFRVAVEQLLGHPQRHPETRQPGLGPVVQVALDPAQLGRGVVEALVARLGQHLDPLLQPLGRAEDSSHRSARLRQYMIGPTPNHQATPVTTGTNRISTISEAVKASGIAARSQARSRQVIGSAAARRSRLSRRAPPAGWYDAGTGPYPGCRAGHLPVDLGEPTGDRQRHHQQRDTDHEDREHHRDHVGDEQHQRGHGEQELGSGVRGQAKAPYLCHPSDLHRTSVADASPPDSGLSPTLIRVLPLLIRAPDLSTLDESRKRNDSRSPPCHLTCTAQLHRPVALRAARWSATHPWRAIGAWFAFVVIAVALAALVPTKQTTDADYRIGDSGRADAMRRPAASATTRPRAS